MTVSADAGSGEVVLSWPADGSCMAESYHLYRATSPTDLLHSDNLQARQSTTGFRDPGLADAASYFYRVVVGSTP